MKDTKKLERLNDVIDRTGYSRAWIYELIKKNSFPKPVKIGARSIAFVESEVDAWINERIAERDGVGANYWRKKTTRHRWLSQISAGSILHRPCCLSSHHIKLKH